MARILVLAEWEQGRVKPSTFAAVQCAQGLVAASGGTFQILVCGHSIANASTALTQWGAEKVLLADHAALAEPLADRYAQVIVEAMKSSGSDWLMGASSTFTKDVLPRAAALLDAAMLSEVIEVKPQGQEFQFRRVQCAGNVIATVSLQGPIRCVNVRGSAFGAPSAKSELSPVEALPVDPSRLPAFAEFVSREAKSAGRPDATEARIVVSGGRALKNSQDFETLVGGLADVLGAAVGSSRALVDAGITPNSLQIGQTGKVVAPDLYLAVGISGAIQHMAGMKDTKVIVAINKDPDAPIFEVADYGLVADVYQAVPELIQKLKRP